MKQSHHGQQAYAEDSWQYKNVIIILTSSVKALKMENPNLITTLIPVDKRKLTENTFYLEKNEKHYLSLTWEITEGLTISSWEVTPAQEQPIDDYCKFNFTHHLQLTFDEKSKNASKGYSFDTDSKKCDVLLRPRGAHSISELHFCITFNDTIDDKKCLILRDSSTNETAVSYSS